MHSKKILFIIGTLSLLFAACALIGCRATVDPNDQKVESTAGNKLTKPSENDTKKKTPEQGKDTAKDNSTEPNGTQALDTVENVVWELTKLQIDGGDSSTQDLYLYLDSSKKFCTARKRADGKLGKDLYGTYTLEKNKKEAKLHFEENGKDYNVSYTITTGDSLKVTGASLSLEGKKAQDQAGLSAECKELLK